MRSKPPARSVGAGLLADALASGRSEVRQLAYAMLVDAAIDDGRGVERHVVGGRAPAMSSLMSR